MKKRMYVEDDFELEMVKCGICLKEVSKVSTEEIWGAIHCRECISYLGEEGPDTWVQGWDARIKGIRLDECPYGEDVTHEWVEGWKEADQERQAEEEEF